MFIGSLALSLPLLLLQLAQNEIIEEMLFLFSQRNNLRLGIVKGLVFLLERLSFDYIQLL
jgi:hypothetical protein